MALATFCRSWWTTSHQVQTTDFQAALSFLPRSSQQKTYCLFQIQFLPTGWQQNIYIYIINPIGNTSSAVLFVSYKNCHQGFINLRQKALAQSRATRNGKPAVCAQLWGSQGQLRPQAMLPWPHCFLEVPLQSPHTCWAVHGGTECQTPSAIMQYAKPSWANAAQRHGGHHSPVDFQATGPF